ncbi:hypothetical protein NQ314_014285 [Rhamnusium bicolor]|uniref:Uncharacterized protein n=1 Tax=Rhamnusium bicolor TaxID=1586634 RepID=A0AAV8X3E8_9CUCU|nr:hypothetical protein NQ314_014285 [Rhamnusium bicolor]
MEDKFQEYLLICSDMFHGLTPKATRRLAYEYAKKNNVKYPEKWKNNGLAGREWLNGFYEDMPADVMQRYQFTPSRIYNLIETEVTTVHRVPRIIGRKGQHQVEQVTSRERGELVTQVGIICANGTSLPPVWVFPRQRFDEKKMMKGVPNQEDGPMGLVYPSGWMTCKFS